MYVVEGVTAPGNSGKFHGNASLPYRRRTAGVS